MRREQDAQHHCAAYVDPGVHEQDLYRGFTSHLLWTVSSRPVVRQSTFARRSNTLRSPCSPRGAQSAPRSRPDAAVATDVRKDAAMRVVSSTLGRVQMSRSPKGARTDPNADVDHLVQAMADVVPLPKDPRGRVRAVPEFATRHSATAHASSPPRHDDRAGRRRVTSRQVSMT